MYHAPLSRARGFSLLELFAVITILGIVAAIVLPQMSKNSSAAREKVRKYHQATINAAVQQYHEDHGTWPAKDLSDLAEDPRYFPEGLPVDPTSDSPYLLDPVTHRVIE